MPSLTSWQRCEPHARAADPATSLAMGLEDPLWLLGRQWQFGEIEGDDAGSPVWLTCSGALLPMAAYLPGRVDGHQASDVQAWPAAAPLDEVVERERWPADAVLRTDRRLAVQAGWQFLQCLPPALAQDHRAALRAALGLMRPSGPEHDALDAASRGYLDLMSGRALDGARLLQAVQGRTPQEAATALGFVATETAPAALAVSAWLAWVEAAVGPVAAAAAAARSSWNPSRLEYDFAVALPADAQGAQHLLEAVGHDGGVLDWYAFDLRQGALAKPLSVAPTPLTVATLPTGVNFRGMPARRLWEFEDGRVDFGGMSAAATDLTRLLFVEFMLQYGNDFYVIPIEQPSGTACRFDRVEVLNNFGETTLITPIADPQWRMYALSAPAGVAAPPLLFLPPVVAQEMVGAPLESLQLLRDEMANLCWAIEQVVESAAAAPLRRHEAWQAALAARDTPAAPTGAGITYRLDTWAEQAPDYWFPLLQADAAASGVLTLRGAGSSRPLGRLLAEIADLGAGRVFDEEISRAGAIVERHWQYCRWHNGGLQAWVTRHKRCGRGEGSSGLAFDVAKPT